MAESSFTREQYDRLCAAIAMGTLEVDYGDKKVHYRSLDDMLRIRRMIAADLGIAIPTGYGKRLTTFSKNWHKDNECC